jgi:uncharacterized protein YacL
MSRAKTVMAHHSESSAASESSPKQRKTVSKVESGSVAGAWLGRAAVVLCLSGVAATWQPFGLGKGMAAVAGFVVGTLFVLTELRLRKSETASVIGAATGTILGVLTALLVTLVVSRTAEPEPTKTFLEAGSLIGFGYLGLFLGASKGRELPLNANVAIQTQAENARQESSGAKLLDTSVLIDGRIADVCEALFLDGPLHVPQFVLHELQQIADSPDALRRQRGLEVLQRIQKIPQLKILVVESESSLEGEVDRKLVELAKKSGAKIITNDFNLNKVASVQGIAVLNVNQLANALRPAVLPGEPMRVFILREGKEANQGVAYLEDGTMVVVDGARRLMNKNVDITVTSVHQTPAGKMIFGRLEDRNESAPPITGQAAAGRGENGGRGGDAPSSDRNARREGSGTN